MKLRSLIRSMLLPMLGIAFCARASEVIDWNDALLSAARATRMNPPAFSRAAAITHLAIYDAVNGVVQTHRAYHVQEKAPEGTSLQAAIGAAALTSAMALFDNPGVRQTNFTALYERSLAAVPDGPSKAAGIAWGQTVALALLSSRATDGSWTTATYDLQPAPGIWRPTLPAEASALLPAWGRVKPFALTSGNQFVPHPPPSISSSAYALELNLTKAYGALHSPVRTAEQTATAHFWSDGPGTETPPGHWNHIAQSIAVDRGLSLPEQARLFALLNICLADAAIACWDAKYLYNLWRPITAIREADTDDNPGTEAEPDWLPLIDTPPFPECTSGHSTFSRAAATLLAGYFGTDNLSFTSVSDGLPGVVRIYSRLSDAADEAGISRIYAGLHFPTANISGQACGFSIANHVLAYALQPITSLRFTWTARSGGTTQLVLAVEPMRRYSLRVSSDLRTWEEIATLSSDDGVLRFTDVSAPDAQLRFYQAIVQSTQLP